MTTFAQICSDVLEESDGRVVEFTSTNLGKDSDGVLYVTDPTQRNVIGWVKQAYREIIDLTPYWSFLHKRGTVLRVKEGKVEYSLSIGRVRECSLFFRPTGLTTRIPVYIQPYSWWTELEQSLYISSGQPIYLISAPGSYMVWPTPDRTGEIYGDYWLVGEDLAAANDEPLWHERFHDVVKWQALRKFAAEFQGNDGAAAALTTRINIAFPTRWSAFKREYFPSSQRPRVENMGYYGGGIC